MVVCSSKDRFRVPGSGESSRVGSCSCHPGNGGVCRGGSFLVESESVDGTVLCVGVELYRAVITRDAIDQPDCGKCRKLRSENLLMVEDSNIGPSIRSTRSSLSVPGLGCKVEDVGVCRVCKTAVEYVEAVCELVLFPLLRGDRG